MSQRSVQVRYKSRRLLHQYIYGMHPDEISKMFIHIICADPEIDFMLCDLGVLFAEDPPPMTRDWAHHDGWRPSAR